jgi:[ribosomal protein S5]-alanine N-acetyltransferase
MQNTMDKTRKDIFLDGKRLYLRFVGLSDIGEKYIGWLSDPDVTQFLEVRFESHNLKSVKDFVEKTNSNPDNVFLAIVVKDGNRHIGNIKIGPINWIHKVGDVSLFIGEKDEWGKGYGAEAIQIVVDYAFRNLNLHKITAGVYKPNVNSLKAFKKNGFKVEGIRSKQYYYKGDFVDLYLLGLINKHYEERGKNERNGH